LDRPDRRTGLCIAAVGGHLVGVAECLPVPARPHAAGDVSLRGHQISEDGLATCQQLGVTVLDRLIRGAREEVQGAHRVPLDRLGLAGGYARCEVAGAWPGIGKSLLGSAYIEEEAGKSLDV